MNPDYYSIGSMAARKTFLKEAVSADWIKNKLEGQASALRQQSFTSRKPVSERLHKTTQKADALAQATRQNLNPALPPAMQNPAGIQRAYARPTSAPGQALTERMNSQSAKATAYINGRQEINKAALGIMPQKTRDMSTADFY